MLATVRAKCLKNAKTKSSCPNFLLDFTSQVWHHKFRCPFLLKTQINRCIIIRQPLTALPKKSAYNWQIFNSLLDFYATPEACYIVHIIKTGQRFLCESTLA